MDVSKYATYIPGYTGHIPKIQREEQKEKIQYNKHIPGYSGYIPSVVSENKFGESYGRVTHKSLHNKIPKGAEIPSYDRYTSTMRESFINQRNVQIISTAELLGVHSRKDTYAKPIPISTINNFWGVDDKGFDDDVVTSQTFDQAYKNFWSYVDSNKLNEERKVSEDIEQSKRDFWGINKHVQEVHPELKFLPVPGYQGVNRSIVSENIYGMTYEKSRSKAKELMDKFNREKADQLMKTSRINN